MDFESAARQMVRALRGRRSQTALSRRLGYRTNVLYSWEAGRDYPSAAKFFGLAQRTGVDVAAALERFYRVEPPWFGEHAPVGREGAAALLRDLQGGTSIVDLAEATGYSRFKIARWLKGTTEPRLPEFLALIEAASLRLLDFVSVFTDPAELPALAEAWSALEATRRAAHDVPWTQAVLRCLELEDYRQLRTHRPGWIAARIGISPAEEERSLELLARSGQIRLESGRWAIQNVIAVDTRRDRASTDALRSFWGRQALERMERGDAQLSSYNIFGVSSADLARLRELYTSYFRQMRAIIAQSEPVEHVVLTNFQLVPLSDTDIDDAPA